MRFNRLIPEISVSDFLISKKFYIDIGFKVEYERDRFVMISLQGSQIMIQEQKDTWKTGELEYPYGRGINFQIEVDNVEEILSNLGKIGYPIFVGLKDNWYEMDDRLIGNKEFLIKDPDGYLLRFSQDIGTKSS